MVTASFSREDQLLSSRDRVWKAGVLDTHTIIPKIIPGHVSSIDINGDGGPGTVKKFNFSSKDYPHTAYQIEEIDRENHFVSFNTIDGGIDVPRLKSHLTELKLEVGKHGFGTLVKLRIEYETKDDAPLTTEEEDVIFIGLVLLIRAVDVYLHANPTAYVE